MTRASRRSRGRKTGHRSGLPALLVFGLFFLALLPAPAVAAPANDNFSNPVVLSGSSVSVDGSTVGATHEAGERDHYFSDTKASVWYSWTAPGNGVAVINACESDYSLVSAAYTGSSVGSLSEKAAGWCKTFFPAQAGTVYRIAIDGAWGQTGTFHLNLGLFQPPVNDDFNQATVLSGYPVVVDGDTRGASHQQSEPISGSFGEASVWYRWQAPATGTATIDTCENDFDTAVFVYTGSTLASAFPVNPAGMGGCKASFRTSANTTYRISVDGKWGGIGTFRLKLDLFPPPANDAFANAVTLTGLPTTVNGDNRGATHQSGEPDHFESGTVNSVWFRWVAPKTTRVVFDVCGTGFRSVIAAYTGSSVSGLTWMASDYCWAEIDVIAGVTYSIAVDGEYGEAGPFQLRVEDISSSHNLTVTRTGTGQGAVASNPSGIDCGLVCVKAFEEDTEVTLTASPAAGSDFASWGGACSGGNPSCQVTMSEARAVTANFTLQKRLLTVNRSGGGQGVVTSAPAGIDCGGDCSEEYDDGAQVTLTAAPAAGSGFSGWSGACAGAGACQVTMDQARTVTATFAEDSDPARVLTVTRSGTGQGAVTSNPGGIDCGSDCSEAFDQGTVVTLSASAAVGSSFAGWSGACAGTGTCQVTMSEAKSVGAAFTEDAAPPPGKPALGPLKATPKVRAVRRGKKTTFKIAVRNTGDAPARKVKVCASARKQLLKVGKCVTLGSVGAGESKVAKVTVTVQRKAKKGRKATVTFSASGQGVTKKTVAAAVKVK